ncbi:MAG: F0F1 ATP synthase subunit B [Thalassolituus oleivorans]|uniref:F0F1 ATP synthase subunit delta n=1 Tax=Thalassolituus oleivorans TaxID=187493 RepID=UPI001B69B570|nr:F0F1 ATP synthase subunit delta [Thalassolituus oleivorans]MBQ0728231.1 F0F1 ATP synthase subunit B [Thalassolituus oleivorans]
MLIDWFTVFAQVVNFLILVWLLKRYLYRPILNAIDAREKLIAAELAYAAKQKEDAQTERKIFEAKNAEHNKQAAKLLQQAQDASDAERDRLISEATSAADTMRRKQHEDMARDAKSFKQALSQKVSNEVFAIARKTLSDLATKSLEDSIVEVFISKLNNLASDTKTTLSDALTTTNTSVPPVFRSAFELSSAQQEELKSAINEIFSADIPLEFKTDVALIGGIELSANGQKLAWSIAEYLAALEEGVDALIEQKPVEKAL